MSKIAMWGAILGALGCNVGGPVARELPEERAELRELRAGDRVVRVLGVTRGAQHKGRGPALTTQSEAGLAVEWSRAGERFGGELQLEIPGAKLGGPSQGGRVVLATVEALPSRAEAVARLKSAEVEACWAGTRLAVRVRFSGSAFGSSYFLFDLANPAQPRWGMVLSDAACQQVAEREQALTWHEGTAAVPG